MAVALYARVSTTRQAENELSIPDQLRQMRDWCKAQGLAVAAEYVGPGSSATDDRRPEFQRLIADATRLPSPYDAIIVHSHSRLFRDLYMSLTYERVLNKAGTKIISITQPTSDDPMGAVMRSFMSVMDQYASQENSKHTLRAMQENARQGYWNGSQPPYGFRAVETDAIGNRGRKKRRLEIHPVEAEIVRQIYTLYLSGHDGRPLGMKGIAEYLNTRGKTMRERAWRVQKVNRILSDPAYSGRLYFNRRDSKTLRLKPESEWITVEVPAIISAAIFERVEKRRPQFDPKMHPPKALASPAPLTGLLKCGHCGAGMAQAPGKSGKYRYYKCTTRLSKGISRCDSRNLPREKTDEAVLTAMAERIFTPKRAKLMLEELAKRRRAAHTVEDSRLLALRKELDGATQALNRLYEAVERELLPMEETLRKHAHKLKAKREEALLEIAKLDARKHQALAKVSASSADAFTKVLRSRLKDVRSGFGKA
jgi:DNA invertase Pin-like site-specific DNA recombinase